ncbi:hypothetical protein MRX96_029008 [Rhipicephalus microplus]
MARDIVEETSYRYQPLEAATLRLSARAAAGARVTSANSYNHREGDPVPEAEQGAVRDPEDILDPRAILTHGLVFHIAVRITGAPVKHLETSASAQWAWKYRSDAAASIAILLYRAGSDAQQLHWSRIRMNTRRPKDDVLTYVIKDHLQKQ